LVDAHRSEQAWPLLFHLFSFQNLLCFNDIAVRDFMMFFFLYATLYEIAKQVKVFYVTKISAL